jgi:hypothetical protein
MRQLEYNINDILNLLVKGELSVENEKILIGLE